MRGVELGQLPRIKIAARQGSLVMMLEHAFEKTSAAVRVLKPSVLRHRKVGPQPNEYAGKDADSVSRRPFVLPEDLDPLHSAARGSSLENEAVETGVAELADLVTGVALHPLGQNLAGNGLDQLWFGITALELDRGSRYTEADLELGTHRNPLEESAEDLGEVAITLVASVVAHLSAEQARRNPKPDRLVVVPGLP
jgi:hypothetical protein